MGNTADEPPRHHITARGASAPHPLTRGARAPTPATNAAARARRGGALGAAAVQRTHADSRSYALAYAGRRAQWSMYLEIPGHMPQLTSGKNCGT